MKHEGIPSGITLDFVHDWIKPRVSEKRFRHIKGVVNVSEVLANGAGCDVFLAKLSGWLHDACKEFKDKKLIEMAKEFNLPLDPILEEHGYLLHGPVGAEVAMRELGITHKGIYDAVSEHTLGAVPMSDLSKICFLADCLEESRPKDYTAPIWKALRSGNGFDMDAAIVVASDQGLKFLIEDNKPIHPRTVEVRNHYLFEVRRRNAITS